MAKTELRGGFQIQNFTVLREDLVLDFLGASDWDITNGGANATIVGLKDAVALTSPATLSQLNALESLIGNPMRYKGGFDAATPSPDLDAIDNLVGDTYKVTVAGTYLGVELAVNDTIIFNTDVPAGTTLTGADFDKIDNTESEDLLKTGDIVDNLTTQSAVLPLSANQGYVLKGLIDALDAQVHSFSYGENLAVTNNSAVLPAMANVPVAGTETVYLNGSRLERGSGNDYTIVGGVITMEYTLHTNDKILVDCQY